MREIDICIVLDINNIRLERIVLIRLYKDIVCLKYNGGVLFYVFNNSCFIVYLDEIKYIEIVWVNIWIGILKFNVIVWFCIG